MAAAMKQVIVLALVGLVASVASGEHCPVSFSRSPCGMFTRIESGPNFSIISQAGISQWKSHAVNGKLVTTSLANGSVVERPMSGLTDAERAELDEWRNMDFEEPLFELEKGQLVLSQLGQDRISMVSNPKFGRYVMADSAVQEEIVVDLAKVASYIVQNNRVATFVDRKCELHTMRSSSIFE